MLAPPEIFGFSSGAGRYATRFPTRFAPQSATEDPLNLRIIRKSVVYIDFCIVWFVAPDQKHFRTLVIVFTFIFYTSTRIKHVTLLRSPSNTEAAKYQFV